MSRSKRAKILLRTLVGSTLGAVVTFFLWASSGENGVRLVLIVSGLLALGALVEVHRTGVFGARWLALGAVPALVGVFALHFLHLGVLEREAPPWLGAVDSLGGYWRFLASCLWTALALAPMAFLVARAYRSRRDGARVVAWAPFALALWIVLPLAWMGVVRFHWDVRGLLALLLLSKLGDIAGYYVGSAIGKTHPFPRISPGKTTAGCVGSLVAGAVTGVVCQAIGLFPEARLGFASGLLAGALLNVAAQAGDLLESVLKRRAGVKDSGRIFGPSGGVLDVVDSLLLTVPVALLVWPFLFTWPS